MMLKSVEKALLCPRDSEQRAGMVEARGVKQRLSPLSEELNSSKLFPVSLR